MFWTNAERGTKVSRNRRCARSPYYPLVAHPPLAGPSGALGTELTRGIFVDGRAFLKMLSALLADGSLGFASACCLWLASCYTCCNLIGQRFEWSKIQVLQVYRSVQCGLLAGLGLFSMGVMHGRGQSLSGQCADDVFVSSIINFFLWCVAGPLDFPRSTPCGSPGWRLCQVLCVRPHHHVPH